MKASVFDLHERLRAFPPAQGLYILYRRLVEQGLNATWLWVKDKIVRRTRGYSVPKISKVAPHLYVGGQHKQHGLARMRDDGITAIVNMREESDDAARGLVLDHYLWLPTTDDAAPTIGDLKEGAAFIRRHIEAEEGVYVHCASGVGRAPTMAAAYLVREGATPEAAWRRIRRERPFIRPTPPQFEIIDAFARQPNVTATAHAGDAAPTASPREGEKQQDDAAEPDGPVDPDDRPSPEMTSFSLGQPVSPDHQPADDATMEKRRQMAFERIAGDPMLTADLTDDAAKILLDWAGVEAQRLVAATDRMDDTAAWDYLDPNLRTLRRHVRRIARQSAGAEEPEAKLQELLVSPEYE